MIPLDSSSRLTFKTYIHYYYELLLYAKAVFNDSTTTMFQKAKKKYVICLICVSLTDFPEPSSVLPSMFYHFEPTTILQLGV
jgi:hypothetical protein